MPGRSYSLPGAAAGWGRATAVRFATEGAQKIFLVDHFEDRLDRVGSELAELGTSVGKIKAELADPAEGARAVQEAYRDAGRLDVVVSNAAAWTEEPFLEMKLESWQKVIAVNLTASFVVGQAAARAMVESATKGVILFTASISSLGASPEFGHYGAAKAGTVNLVTVMAVELATYGIRVNCISPGPTDTQQSVDLVGEERMASFPPGVPRLPYEQNGAARRNGRRFFIPGLRRRFLRHRRQPGHRWGLDGPRLFGACQLTTARTTLCCVIP